MEKRLEGIDYIRAVMSVFVVIWHMKGGGHSLIFSRQQYLDHVFTISDLINFHFLLLAVPIFILVANFLYASKPADSFALRRRLKRIVILLTFWPVVFILYNHGISGAIELIPHDIGSFIIFIIGAGNTIYYFFVCLLVSTLLTHFILRLKPGAQCVGAIVSIALLACLPWLTKTSGYYALSAYWSPLNVIPLSFVAVLVAQNLQFVASYKMVIVSLCGVLTILLSVWEWQYAVGEAFFPGQGFAIPAYTRPSLIFGSLVMLIIAIDSRIKSNVVVNFMARYSLGLYCIHPFLMGGIKDFTASLSASFLIINWGSIIMVILCSYCLVFVLSFYIKKDVIM